MQLVDDVIILSGDRIHIGAAGLRQHADAGVDEQLRDLRVRQVDVGIADVRESTCGFAYAVDKLRKVLVSGKYSSRQISRWRFRTR